MLVAVRPSSQIFTSHKCTVIRINFACTEGIDLLIRHTIGISITFSLLAISLAFPLLHRFVFPTHNLLNRRKHHVRYFGIAVGDIKLPASIPCRVHRLPGDCDRHCLHRVRNCFVVLRSIARRKTLSPLGWDDYLIIPALVANLGMCAHGISKLTMSLRRPGSDSNVFNSNGTPHRCRLPSTCSYQTARPCEAGRVGEVHLRVNMDLLRCSHHAKDVDPLSIPSDLHSQAPQDRYLCADGRVDRSWDICRHRDNFRMHTCFLSVGQDNCWTFLRRCGILSPSEPTKHYFRCPHALSTYAHDLAAQTLNGSKNQPGLRLLNRQHVSIPVSSDHPCIID